MSVNTNEERLELTALDRFTSIMDKSAGAVKTLRTEADLMGNSLKAAGAALGVGVLINYGAKALEAATQAEQAGNRMSAVLRATGAQLGVSKKQLDDHADSLARATMFDDEGFRNAQATLLKFGNIHGQVFNQALELSADLAAFLGTDVPEAAQMIGKSLQSPTEGLRALEQTFGKLTEAEEKHINELVKQGRAVEAQMAVLELYRSKVGGVEQQMNQGLTKATKGAGDAWGDLLEALGQTTVIGGSVIGVLEGIERILRSIESVAKNDPMKGFRNSIDLIEQEIARIERSRPAKGRSALTDQQLERLRGERDNLRELIRAAESKAVDPFAFNPNAVDVVLGGSAKDGKSSGDPDRHSEQDLARAMQMANRELAELEKKIKSIDEGTQNFIDALGGPLVEAAEEAVKQSEEMLYTWDALGNRVVLTKEQVKELAEAEKEAAKRNAEIAREARREWERTAEQIEQALATAIIAGGQNGLDALKRALATAFIMPIIQPIIRPMAQAGASVAHGLFGGGGGMFGLGGMGSASAGGTAGGGGMGSIFGGTGLFGSQTLMDFNNYFGNIGQLTETGEVFGMMDAAGGFVNANPWLAAVGPVMQLLGGDTEGAAISAGLGAAGFAIGGPVGAMIGTTIGGLLGGGKKKDRRSSGGFSAGFGEDLGWSAFSDGRYLSDATHGQALLGFSSAQASSEQNLIRNLGLSGEQIAAVNAALGDARGKRYFYAEGKDSAVDPAALQQVQAERVAAISKALGRSIEELTQIMAMSAEQWQATIEQMEKSVQEAERTLHQASTRGLEDQLGISAITGYQASLAIGTNQSPSARFGAARSQLEQAFARAMGGDLDAARSFPQVLQQALGIGQEVYASGSQFQELFTEGNTMLNDLLEKQRAVQADIVKEVPAAILQASNDQIAVLKAGFGEMVKEVQEMRRELERLRAA